MRIGDLATASGLTTKTIRFYEQTGLLPAPPRTPGGYRDYPEQTTARLAFIRDAQRAGLTLTEIRSVLALRDTGQSPCRHVTALIDQHLADIELRLAELAKTRDALHGLARRAATTDPATCTEADICTILVPGDA
ncbi:MerR family transcriptional regulator [Streptomyces sp. JS01]|uniref:MerR family transcriptional regulator n=2 Tax=Streptomyces TaxID=1883 RepID=A0A1E7LSD9_9ACTN|nr:MULTISPECIES: heavy metal-responsive transcriptional regulator [Streptomyces]KAA6203214.1 heavy metal-responsive transcriptional regulator [Streptomyces parvus]KFK88139.1 MerR family transcriptional regulator [Streptomyces sp. JS01]OEV19122.1 MerR family transcriptional regulator [Streptomyces nanshensis]UCA51583.1 heavy metal-responsive transcriptional regulator [Streptomyces sp. WA6-1-16]GGS40521.1 heavy metal-responsive transcriptional regulator [Streptomyces parvus]